MSSCRGHKPQSMQKTLTYLNTLAIISLMVLGFTQHMRTVEIAETLEIHQELHRRHHKHTQDIADIIKGLSEWYKTLEIRQELQARKLDNLQTIIKTPQPKTP